MKNWILIIFFLISGTLTSSGQKRINNIFYVQNTLGSFKNAPLSAQGKASLLKSIGFEALEGFGLSDFFELKKALTHNGLMMPVNYISLNFGQEGKPFNPSSNEIKSMIKAMDRGSLIYFLVSSIDFKENRTRGDQVLTGILKDLSDFAVQYGIKLCVYPHVLTYCETVANSVKLAKLVNRPNFGASMNLCHLLKVEGAEGIETTIKEFTPWLVAVNICGADDGDTRNMDWDRLIQPLGQGSFDTYRIVKLLIDNGYKGPIGLQCYNLKGDAAETLTRSLNTWKSYKKRYELEK